MLLLSNPDPSPIMVHAAADNPSPMIHTCDGSSEVRLNILAMTQKTIKAPHSCRNKSLGPQEQMQKCKCSNKRVLGFLGFYSFR